MSADVHSAANKPLERPAARIRSLAAAHWQRSAGEAASDGTGHAP
jgi:hypothetical protein